MEKAIPEKKKPVEEMKVEEVKSSNAPVPKLDEVLAGFNTDGSF